MPLYLAILGQVICILLMSLRWDAAVGATSSVVDACIAVAGVCWRSRRRGARVGGAEGRRVACSSGRGSNSPPPDRDRGGL
ncbi:hypothetical protein E2C01_047790 [Portunus trituberculatus]|uniref:Secreted protein n=1 Tax=Portunus trituberculatus TaxID=210409 RepID=A0A5B7G8P5_PORTR|nr:hypothetical protein [Portunus trituberculatus]